MENLFDHIYNYIYEAKFTPKSWAHEGKYDYPVALIDDILNTGKVAMEDHGEQIIELHLSNKDRKELEDIKSHVKDANAMERFDILMSKFGVSFKKIYKGKFTGQSGKGSIFESLVCYLFNYPEGNISDWFKAFNAPNDTGWIDSSIKSAEIIREFINKHSEYGSADDYIAIHVDGKDLIKEKPADLDLIMDIASIFKGKGPKGLGGFFKKYGNKNAISAKNASDLYNGTKKDKWNPADIVLIKKDNIKLEEIRDEIIKGGTGTATNNILVAKLGEGLIIPISLKKIDKKGGAIYGHHIGEADEMKKHEITSTKISLAARYSDGLTGNLLVIGISEGGNPPSQVEIRAQTGSSGHDDLSIEALSASGKAREGKGISVVKDALGIKDNSYYANFANNEELFNEFAKYKFIDENNKPIDKCPAEFARKDLYKKTCFRGFFGLLELFNAQVKSNPKLNKSYNNADTLLDFAQFLWNSCTDCPGSYYIVK